MQNIGGYYSMKLNEFIKLQNSIFQSKRSLGKSCNAIFFKN